MGRDINLHASFIRPNDLDLATVANGHLPEIIKATNQDECSAETWAARWFLEDLAKDGTKPGLIGRLFGKRAKAPKQMVAWGTTGEFWEPTHFVEVLQDLWTQVLQADSSKNILVWTQDEEDKCCYELVVAVGPDGRLVVSEPAPVAATWSPAPDIEDLDEDEEEDEDEDEGPISPPPPDGLPPTPASLLHVSCNSGPDRASWRQAATQILPALPPPETPPTVAAHEFLNHVVNAGDDPGWMHVWAYYGELDARDFIQALMPFWEATIDPWIAVVYSQAAGASSRAFLLCKPEDCDDRPLWILPRDNAGAGYFRAQ